MELKQMELCDQKAVGASLNRTIKTRPPSTGDAPAGVSIP